MTPFDNNMYPDVINRIFANANSQSLVVLRNVCRAWKKRADALLVRHIFLCSSEEGAIEILALDPHAPNGAGFRVPTLCPPLTSGPNANPVFARHIHFVDFAQDLKAELVPKWIYRLRNVQIVREDCKPPSAVADSSQGGQGGEGEEGVGFPLPNTTRIPPCDVYVTRGPLPFFPSRGPFPVRAGGRIVIPFDNPSQAKGVNPVACLDGVLLCIQWLIRYSDWDGEVVVLIKPPPELGEADEEYPHTGALDTITAIASDIANGLTLLATFPDLKCPLFTFVNLPSWTGDYCSADNGLHGWFEGYIEVGLDGEWSDEADLPVLLSKVGFEMMDSYCHRIGARQFEYEMGTWDEEECEWVMA